MTAGTLAVLAFSGCGAARERADLVFINGVEPESLDPAIISGQPEGRLVMALFEGLTSRDAAGVVGPGMAERWEVSPDGREYTFHIRGGARWSNGDPLTAQDFVRSWERTLNPLTTSPYSELLFSVDGAEDYAKGKLTDFSKVGVAVVDDRTLRVRLRAPTPYFLELCAFQTHYPVHLSSIERYGIDWIKPGKLVSNGAYRLVEWRINDRIRLEANPHYWRAASVRLKTVEALPISQATTAFNFYSTGLADLTLDKGVVPPMLLDELRKRPDCHIAPVLATYFYRFNVTRKPFDDPRVRRAFAMALDKQFIVGRITRNGEPAAGSFTPPGIRGYDPPRGLPHDPDAARRLLAEAGYPGGSGFPPFGLLFNSTEQDEEIAVAVQDLLRRELGVRVELRRQEWKVYLNSLNRLDFDMARSTWVADYPDPNTFLDCFVTGRGNNRTGWSNARYDSLLDASNRTLDPAARFGLMRRAEEILVEGDVPIAPVYHYVGVKLYDARRIGGIVLNPIDEYPIREMYRIGGPP
ncbi:MAG TPA: peptide ABC transporter substrate-binding protein [Verrucomicrobiae bacterium]|nr:peptide ABC transporter substrate-binding protein [Verrucomicrobiae bacterium]